MSAGNRKSYTVKKLAELSGVSGRTLRFYDEIGLLRPAFHGENGYRYYGHDQLLALQQILFYRELGFALAQIGPILASSEFDRIAALRAHRHRLVAEAERTRLLVNTIDKTLAHLEREQPMKENELYLGFDPEKQAEYERQATEHWGEGAREPIEESKRRTRGWSRSDFEQVGRDYHELHAAFTEALGRGVAPSAPEVQALVRKHFGLVSRFWTPRRHSYIGLGRSYCEHPDFRKLYAGFHPGLAEFLAEAMRLFAERELSAT